MHVPPTPAHAAPSPNSASSSSTMADDESTESESEHGTLSASSSVVNGRRLSAAVADDAEEFQAQLDEAVQALRRRGQTSLAELSLLLLRLRLRLRSAMWLLGDHVRPALEVDGDPALFDGFRHCIRGHVLSLQQQAGYSEHMISEEFPRLVLQAAQQHAARLADLAYGNGGGFGTVAASATVIRSLEKQMFHAGGGSDDDGGVTECSICFEGFVDGGEVSVMPCPCRGHRFHPDCIAKWLGISSMCPLCRHELPA